MAQLPEDLEFELEALRSTYGDEQVSVELGGSGADGPPAAAAAVVALPVAPRTDAEHEQFVGGRLVLAVGASYPEEAPGVQLADAKGTLGGDRLPLSVW